MELVSTAENTNAAKIQRNHKRANIVSWILTIAALVYGIGAIIHPLLHSWLLTGFINLIYIFIMIVIGIIAWLYIFLILLEHSNRRGLIVCQLVIGSVFLAGGTLWTMTGIYKPIQSQWHNGSSYHLMFMSDLTDVASYDVLKCDVLGIRCELIFNGDNYYNRDGWTPREDAHLKWDETTQQITFILNNQLIFTEPIG